MNSIHPQRPLQVKQPKTIEEARLMAEHMWQEREETELLLSQTLEHLKSGNLIEAHDCAEQALYFLKVLRKQARKLRVFK